MSDSAAFIVTRRALKELSDGTLRVQFDVEPNDKRTFLDAFPDIGVPMAVAALDPDAVAAIQRGETIRAAGGRVYGEQARTLRLSGFLRVDIVWRALGRDSDFIEWLRTQKCVARAFSFPDCSGDIVAAHVRRTADGAGVGIKPLYSAVPLCDGHHRLQHQHGEEAVGGKAWLAEKRIECLERWAWERLRAEMGVTTMAECDPVLVRRWAEVAGVANYLPEVYRDAV